MREGPILYSAPMVQAILDDRKAMTRRVIKHQPVMLPDFNRGGLSIWTGGSKYQAFCPSITAMHCPYGKVGDRLWVRESWRTYKSLDHLPPRLIKPGVGIEYRAGGTNVPGSEFLFEMGKSRPSIFMPRWASRITLEITGVKVERLQEISEEEANAEGVECVCLNLPCTGECQGGYMHYLRDDEGEPAYSAKESFASLWDNINGKTPGKSWDDNPYVWAVSFKRVEE